MKQLFVVVLFLVVLSVSDTGASASVDPRGVPNNIYGIHIVDENDLPKAAELVNGNGGAWGYVTMVIREDERNREKWQSTFDKMREMKLIPIVRLATGVESGAWKKASHTDEAAAKEWASFLNSLNWVVKNRYIILFNEPNHAKEWGGSVSPFEYAKAVRLYRNALKDASGDFFILGGGLDLAADKTPVTMRAEDFYRQMYLADNDIFKLFDGLSSHSYPNPNFSGSVWDIGRESVKGFEWELGYLKQFGLPDNMPVFITETGWAHSDGRNGKSNGYKNSAQVADSFKSAFENVWNVSNVVAVTPFILNYQDSPFDHFSWIRPGGTDVYPQYEMVKNLAKTKGEPVQEYRAEAIKGYFPSVLATDSKYKVAVRFSNTGQAIWENENVTMSVSGDYPAGSVVAESLPKTVPGVTSKVWVEVDTNGFKGDMKIEVVLNKGDVQLSQPLVYEVKVEEASLLIKFKLMIDKVLNNGNLVVMLVENWRKIFAFLATTPLWV